jgi:hypothetical protein
MLQAAFPLTLAVSNHPRGVFVLLGLLDQLSARIWDDPVNCEPGLKASGAACRDSQESGADERQGVTYQCGEAVGGCAGRSVFFVLFKLYSPKCRLSVRCTESKL